MSSSQSDNAQYKRYKRTNLKTRDWNKTHPTKRYAGSTNEFVIGDNIFYVQQICSCTLS